MQRHHLVQERPLTPRDYDVPVGWWGWNWEPPVPMSVSELLEARNFDARTAALAWMVLEAHGSLLIAAEQPHSGKTTTLTAFLDFLPNDMRRVFIRAAVAMVKADGRFTDGERRALGQIADAFGMNNAEFGDLEQEATRVQL